MRTGPVLPAMCAALLLAGCASGPQATSGPGQRPPTAAAAAAQPTPAPRYPDAPAVAWAASAVDLALAAGLDMTSPLITDPGDLRPWEGIAAPALLDRGSVWVTGLIDLAQDSGPPAILALDPATGAVRWVYRPADGGLADCGDVLPGDVLVCRQYEQGAGNLRLVDPETGVPLGGFDPPEGVVDSVVDGEHVLALLPADDGVTLTKLTRAGEEVWATRIEVATDDLDESEITLNEYLAWTTLGLGESRAVIVRPPGLLVLVDRTTGAVLQSLPESEIRFTPGDSLLVGVQGPEGTVLTLVRPDGAEVATFRDHVILSGILDRDEGAVLLRDPVGEVVLVDPESGITRPTGVVLGEAPWYSASSIDRTLVAGSDRALTAHHLDRPDEVVWEARAPLEAGGLADDGALLYSSAAAGRTARVAARGIDDGVVRWDVGVDLPGTTEGDVTRRGPVFVGGRLVLADSVGVIAFEAPPASGGGQP